MGKDLDYSDSVLFGFLELQGSVRFDILRMNHKPQGLSSVRVLSSCLVQFCASSNVLDSFSVLVLT